VFAQPDANRSAAYLVSAKSIVQAIADLARTAAPLPWGDALAIFDFAAQSLGTT
jgi:hypothetical protein